MLKKRLAVTQKPASSPHSGVNFFSSASNNDAIFGIYLSTNTADPINPERIHSLIELVRDGYGQPPDCYLVLESSHKGRVDARLFADAALTVSLPLNMQEDRDPMVNHDQSGNSG